jgi:hypothetical protein
MNSKPYQAGLGTLTVDNLARPLEEVSEHRVVLSWPRALTLRTAPQRGDRLQALEIGDQLPIPALERLAAFIAVQSCQVVPDARAA